MFSLYLHNLAYNPVLPDLVNGCLGLCVLSVLSDERLPLGRAHFLHLFFYGSPSSWWAGDWTPSLTHLSDMAICSSIAEPVFVFQFPEIDVLLQQGPTKIGQAVSHTSNRKAWNFPEFQLTTAFFTASPTNSLCVCLLSQEPACLCQPHTFNSFLFSTTVHCSGSIFQPSECLLSLESL